MMTGNRRSYRNTRRKSAAFNVQVGRRLRIARMTAGGLSGQQVADALGMPLARYMAIEKGRESAFAQTIVRASSLLSVSTDFLLGVSSDPSLDNTEPGFREWLISAAARQASDRAELAEKYAAIEARSDAIETLLVDLIGTAEDLTAALERVQKLNPNDFQDLRAGAPLVAAAEECRLAVARTRNAIPNAIEGETPCPLSI
ncbi:helix-turn-helix domain-containing protein [Zobellella iuensis]|uniref:Helix-turn-helix transcriptional regulator n=1 Tax=Zobellella iuensis TaxID=2803811 RepID=A0ABS1QN42_9GAMM|nr:helix-turn-helix domain-containing protein [Zobellella iuensis]MBL1376260.1 helix-turn-helix transcriptional regulator [Zobellella iuensis]